MRDGRVLMDGGLVNPLPFDVLSGDADITVAIDVSGASLGPGKRAQPTPLATLIASSQILQRTIVREKLKAQQPDIYVDVEVDEFYVLDFHRFEQGPRRRRAAPRISCIASSTACCRATRQRWCNPPRRPHGPASRKKRIPRLKRLTTRRHPA